MVLISSTSALGNRGQTNYSTAKAGLQGMTKTLAIELGPFNVNVNCVAPGFIATAMTQQTAERIGVPFEQFMAAAAAAGAAAARRPAGGRRRARSRTSARRTRATSAARSSTSAAAPDPSHPALSFVSPSHDGGCHRTSGHGSRGHGPTVADGVVGDVVVLQARGACELLADHREDHRVAARGRFRRSASSRRRRIALLREAELRAGSPGCARSPARPGCRPGRDRRARSPTRVGPRSPPSRSPGRSRPPRTQ